METLTSSWLSLLRSAGVTSPAGTLAATVGTLLATYAGYSLLRRHIHASRAAASLSSSVIVITGASSGIGRSCALLLACRYPSAQLILLARSAPALNDVVATVTATGGRAVCFPLDCSDAVNVERVTTDITSRYGTPHVVINAAGAGRWEALWEAPASAFAQALDAPTLAAAYVTRAFLPGMLQRGAGEVVMVQSPASRFPFPGSCSYCTSRWALRGLTASLRADLHGTRLRVKEVILGETSSNYFVANAGASERLPGIGVMLPKLTPEQAARAVHGALCGEAEEVASPALLGAFISMHVWMPGVVQGLINATGWSVSKAAASTPQQQAR